MRKKTKTMQSSVVENQGHHRSLPEIIIPEERPEYIFLDVDGVLNRGDAPGPSSWLLPTALNPYHPHLVMWLDAEPLRIFDSLLSVRPNAKIVMSSSWRRLLKTEDFVREFLAAGLKGAERIIDVTAVRWGSCPRGYEITEWLKKNGAADAAIVALDDCVGSCRPEDFNIIPGKLVLVDPNVGLSESDVAAAVQILDVSNRKKLPI